MTKTKGQKRGEGELPGGAKIFRSKVGGPIPRRKKRPKLRRKGTQNFSEDTKGPACNKERG